MRENFDEDEVFDTIEALLDTHSPLFRQSFALSLAAKLQQLVGDGDGGAGSGDKN